MPALYNAHAHAPMTLLRGYAENLPRLQRWLEEKCFPFEAKNDRRGLLLGHGARLCRDGALRRGQLDMYYATEERARVVLEAGMKANMCEGLVAFEEKPYAEYPICAQMEARARLARGRRRTHSHRLQHPFEYLSTETVCRDILDTVRGTDLRLHIHLSDREGSARVPRAPWRPHAGGLFRQLGVVRGARDGGSLRVGG